MDSIAIFPIAIDPLNYTQPTGCISNYQSGIRNMSINFDSNSSNIKVYVINYNILNISDGRCQKMIAS